MYRVLELRRQDQTKKYTLKGRFGNRVYVYKASEARSNEKYTLKDRFENRVYVYKASGRDQTKKIYT